MARSAFWGSVARDPVRERILRRVIRAIFGIGEPPIGARDRTERRNIARTSGRRFRTIAQPNSDDGRPPFFSQSVKASLDRSEVMDARDANRRISINWRRRLHVASQVGGDLRSDRMSRFKGNSRNWRGE